MKSSYCTINVIKETRELLEGIYQLRKALGQTTSRADLTAEALVELYEKIKRDYEQA